MDFIETAKDLIRESEGMSSSDIHNLIYSKELDEDEYRLVMLVILNKLNGFRDGVNEIIAEMKADSTESLNLKNSIDIWTT